MPFNLVFQFGPRTPLNSGFRFQSSWSKPLRTDGRFTETATAVQRTLGEKRLRGMDPVQGWSILFDAAEERPTPDRACVANNPKPHDRSRALLPAFQEEEGDKREPLRQNTRMIRAGPTND